LQIVASFSYL